MGLMGRAGRISLVAALAAMLLSAAGCASDKPSEAQRCRYSGDEIFPFTSLTDWVSYADQVSVVHAVSERAGQSGFIAEDEAAPRFVTLAIEDNIWTHSERRHSASVGSRIELQTIGWTVKDGRLINHHAGCPEEVDVGERFLVPLFHVRTPPTDLPLWGHLNRASLIPLDGDVCAPTTASRAAQALAGKTTSQVHKRLQETEASPLAAKYAHLRPFKRLLAVSREMLRTR